MGRFVDFAEVKAHCSIEQAAKLLGLQNTEERSHMREPCPICGGGRGRLLLHPPKPLPSKAEGDQIALVSHIKGVSQKDDAATLMLGQSALGISSVTSTGEAVTDRLQTLGIGALQDAVIERCKTSSPLDYLEADHITVEALELSQETAEALGIGYAPKGMMKGYVAQLAN